MPSRRTLATSRTSSVFGSKNPCSLCLHVFSGRNRLMVQLLELSSSSVGMLPSLPSMPTTGPQGVFSLCNSCQSLVVHAFPVSWLRGRSPKSQSPSDVGDGYQNVTSVSLFCVWWRTLEECGMTARSEPTHRAYRQ
jgi:hypothetical protein